MVGRGCPSCHWQFNKKINLSQKFSGPLKSVNVFGLTLWTCLWPALVLCFDFTSVKNWTEIWKLNLVELDIISPVAKDGTWESSEPVSEDKIREAVHVARPSAVASRLKPWPHPSCNQLWLRLTYSKLHSTSKILLTSDYNFACDHWLVTG